MGVKQLLSRNCDWKSWPRIDESVLTEDERYRYQKLHDAVVDVCAGSQPSKIKSKYGISKSLMAYYLSRCLQNHNDGKIVGFRALVANSFSKDYLRIASSDKEYSRSGFSGSFGKLMSDYPLVYKWLLGRLKGKDKDSLGLKLSLLHQDFLTELRKNGCASNCYPFNTSRHAYESFCTWIRKILKSGDFVIAEQFFGDFATQGKGRNQPHAILRPIVSLERVAYDEYSLPNISSFSIINELESKEIPLNRIYFCPIVDFFSSNILGFSLSIGRGFNSSDILKAFEFYISPKEKYENKIFNKLPSLIDEGFPTQTFSFLLGRRIFNLCLDNHLSHLANSVVIDLRNRTGLSITFGPVRSWINRYVVEGVFSEFQEELKTLPSSTGSGPNNSLVKDPVGMAIKYRVHIDDICDLIAKLCRRHNAQRRRSLMSLTPNEKISNDWNEYSRFSILPKYSGEFMSSPEIAVEKVWVTVRGAQSKGRVPYIQLDDAQYTNDILRQNWSLIGKKLFIHIADDYRTVKAFRENGTFFGILSVSGVWSLTPHTRATRKEINKLYRESIFHDRSSDPVLFYQKYLLENIRSKTKKKGTPKISSDANKLIRTMNVDSSEGVTAEIKKVTDTAKKDVLFRSRGRRSFFSEK